MGIQVDNSTASDRSWGAIDKSALGRRLAEAYAAGDVDERVIREAYAYVPDDAFGEDGEGKPVFHYTKAWGPHHELRGDTLVLNRDGVHAAAGALAGARAEPSLSGAALAEAKRHIRRHYREHLKEELPDSLRENHSRRRRKRFVESAGEVVELIESDEEPRRIRAIGITADVVNANGRRYPAEVLRTAVEELKTHLHESAGQGRAILLGEAEHPSDKQTGRPNLLETVVKWEAVEFDGRQVILEGTILPTSKGRDILVLMEGGVLPGVSQRGYGKARVIKENGRRIEEVVDLTITGYDLVLEPSDPVAGVTMFESQEVEMDREQLLEMLRDNPDVFEGIVAQKVEEMTEAQRQALEKQMREALGIGPEDDLAKALKEAAEAKRELEERRRREAVEKAIQEHTKDLPYGDLNSAFIEAVKASDPQTPDDVKAIVEAKRKEYDAIVAKARLAAMGYRGVQVVGPVLERETGYPEYARGAFLITESLARAGLARVRDFRKPRTPGEIFAAQYLERFDALYRQYLLREAQMLAEAEQTSDLNLPYSVARAVVAEAVPTLVAVNVFDFGMTDQAPARIYYEDYSGETGETGSVTDESVTADHDAWVDLAHQRINPGSVVVTDDTGGTTYTEGADYLIDYKDGKLMALSTGSITDGQALLVDYTYLAIREGEMTAIQRGKQTLSYKTLEIAADRLAAQISREAIVFARSQIGWDATTRTIASLIRRVREKIDKDIFYEALTAVLQVSNNSGGTWTAATDSVADLIKYIGYAKVKVLNRYYQPTAIVCSVANSDIISNSDIFTAAGERPDADLDANGFVGRVKGLPVFETTQFTDSYILVVNRELVMHRVFQPMQVKGPYPSYDSNGKLIAAEQYYVEEFNGTDAPIPEKGAYVKIA